MTTDGSNTRQDIRRLFLLSLLALCEVLGAAQAANVGVSRALAARTGAVQSITDAVNMTTWPNTLPLLAW